MKMWSGRFRKSLDPRFEQWQRSFPFDQKLLRYEVAASSAYAAALGALGVFSAEERNSVQQALKEIGRKGEEGRPEFFNDPEAEDVHHFVEKQLVSMIGDTGKKLHSGRSRNEQIATDLRLFVRHSLDNLTVAMQELLEALLKRAEDYKSAVMPAYTHLQRAEPVLAGHWLMAYFQMFRRDLGRLRDCRKRMNECPLGSGAVAGSTLPLDRDLISRQLEFDRPTANSMDATSDRDFALEFVNVLSLTAVHLSRWAEELILFSTQEYGFVLLPEEYATGSSAMPQKQNPDALELIRGKAGRVLGSQTALLTGVKGLPLAYNKDMQETQEPLFDAATTVQSCVEIATGFMHKVEFNRDRMREACGKGFMNAFAAATYLVKQGVPFRQAHEVVAHAVQLCIEKGCELDGLSLEELRQFHAAFGPEVYEHLTLDAVIACHEAGGGTALHKVERALRDAKDLLVSTQETHGTYA